MCVFRGNFRVLELLAYFPGILAMARFCVRISVETQGGLVFLFLFFGNFGPFSK